MNIILGLTGSVATVLYEKIIKELQSIATVNVVLTPSAEHFIHSDDLTGIRCFREEDEWTWHSDCGHSTDKWQKGEPVQHIKLRDSASALVIAPCSANTLAKLANGISDNLLTSIARAWDFNRPCIIAPAMNTYMWEHPITQEHIAKLKSWGYQIVNPQSKMLACGTNGMGALAEIEDIIKVIKEELTWQFPLSTPHKYYAAFDPNYYSYAGGCPGIPVTGHPGSFLHERKMHTHTGVDLYCKDGQYVYAAECGKVVGIENFTGTTQQTPWWEDTQCILIEGASGVICYGEVTPKPNIDIGTNVAKGQNIAVVKRVLKPGKLREDIPGHSESMLHIELYPHGKYKAFEELGPTPDSFSILRDPTPFLKNATHAPAKELCLENE